MWCIIAQHWGFATLDPCFVCVCAHPHACMRLCVWMCVYECVPALVYVHMCVSWLCRDMIVYVYGFIRGQMVPLKQEVIDIMTPLMLELVPNEHEKVCEHQKKKKKLHLELTWGNLQSVCLFYFRSWITCGMWSSVVFPEFGL